MVNYQLYRTNVTLGGQMKYDIILDSAGQNLIATDFHITPISSSVPYNKHIRENLLLYKHKDNISRYYKKISGHFYDNCGDTHLQGLYPLISNDEGMDLHDSSYEMGCHRKLYQLYKKQFEFFVPLWLEGIPKDKCLNFEFQVFTNQNQSHPICKKNFILGKVANHKFHNDFVNYLNEYFEYVGIFDCNKDVSNSDVLNINPSTDISTISGFDVKIGSTRICNIPHLLTNIFSRELPLIESDNMIISNFSNNHMIVNQLYNFNLCFNIEDILTPNLVEMIKGNPVILKLVVGFSHIDGTGGVVLEKRDFYTNYEHIPKTMCGGMTYLKVDQNYNITELSPFRELEYDSKLNVLNYLSDYKCAQYTTINKINPSILHWSLVADNDYIFNTYAGFAGYYLEKDKFDKFIIKSLNGDEPMEYSTEDLVIYGNNYTYANSANIVESEVNKNLNQLAWVKHVCFLEDLIDTNLGYIYSQLETLKKYATVFDGSLISGISYPYNPSVRLCFVTYYGESGKLDKMISDRINHTFKSDNKVVFQFIIDNDTVFVIYDNPQSKYMLLPNFITVLEGWKLKNGGKIITDLLDILKNAHDGSQAITLPKSLDIVLADGPSLSTTEIEYVKNDTIAGPSMLRVFGKIRPTFISNNDSKYNIRYSKKVIKPVNLTDQSNKYIQSKFLPQFPSIGHYYFESSHEEYGKKIRDIEGYSYDVGKLLCLDSSISVKLESTRNENGDYVKVDDLIKAFIQEYYNIPDETQLNYIKSLYAYTMLYDYKSVDNIDDYVYDVKLELK